MIAKLINKFRWNKIGLWTAAIANQAQVVYPGLTEADILQSIDDGTFLIGLVKCFISLILVRSAVLIKS
jgi:hypothetical protein